VRAGHHQGFGQEIETHRQSPALMAELEPQVLEALGVLLVDC
jgi:hypothetical protein